MAVAEMATEYKIGYILLRGQLIQTAVADRLSLSEDSGHP